MTGLEVIAAPLVIKGVCTLAGLVMGWFGLSKPKDKARLKKAEKDINDATRTILDMRAEIERLKKGK